MAGARESLCRLRHPVVRDLAWVIGAPGLLRPEAFGAASSPVTSDLESCAMLDRGMDRLLELDRDPSDLLTWLEAQAASKLLGRYFEALVGFWIRRLLSARRFEHSIRVVRDKQVVGEMDFVFEDSEGVLRHWESSVKFYLCTAADPEGAARADSFLGTMTRDRLDKKIHRLFEKQLGMPGTPEGADALRALGFDPCALAPSRLLMKGALFYPAGPDWRSYPHPREVSPDHQRGWWSAELPEGDAWVVLDRRRWLSPFFADAEEFAPLTRDQMFGLIRAHFSEHRTAFMVAAVERSEAWIESHRGLVVHPGWPWPVRCVSKRCSAPF